MNWKTLLYAAVFSLTNLSFSSALTVLVDGVPLKSEVPAQIIEDRTFIPLSSLSTALGAKVKWNAKDRSVLISKGTEEFSIRIGENSAQKKDGTKIALSAAPRIIEGRTMVPLSSAADFFEIPTAYDAGEKIVYVGKRPSPTSSQTDPAGLGESTVDQDIILISLYKNFAWEYQSHGFFIDKNGKKYDFDFSKKSPEMSEEEMLSEMKKIMRTGEGSSSSLTAENIENLHALAKKVDLKKDFSKTSRRVDSGQRTLYGVRSAKDGQSILVKIHSEGDWLEEPQDPSAQKFHKLYLSLLSAKN